MRRFFRKLFHRGRMYREMEQELAFHREMAEQHAGSIPLGNTAVIAEYGYDIWRFQWIENLWRDLVYAARGLRRSPLLVATALLSLGLGIGVNATMFSLGMEFLFSEPSVTDASSLVYVRLGGNSHATPEALDFLARSGVFAAVAGENEEVLTNFNDGVETRPVSSVLTTANYFTALGVPMLHGRGIESNDPAEVAVLSYSFWRREFNGDPSAVGRKVNLDGRLCTVLGVLPEHHRTLIGYGYSPEVYLPHYLPSTLLAMYARLKPEMPAESARAAVMTVAKRMDAAMPSQFKYEDDVRISPISGFARLRSDRDMTAIALFFVALLLVTGLVLLIACVNVASLLLARASVRRREIAIRLAIGASRGRLLQQLLADSLLLALLGAGAGVALAEVTARLLARVQLPTPVPILLQVRPDWRLAVYAAALTTVATLVGGLLPAWQSVKESLAPDLHRENKMRLRRVLVVAQVAVSVIVLTTGLLFLRNLVHSSALSPGFDVPHAIRVNVNLPPAGYADGDRKLAYVERVLSEFRALPGVESAAAARVLPFNGATRFSVEIAFPDDRQKRQVFFHWNAVTPQFFRAMGIPLLQGRSFTAQDRGENVVVVNTEFVRRYLNGRPAVGTVFLWGRDGDIPNRIVGVAEATKTLTIGEADQPQLYEPLAQITNDRQELEFVLRTAVPPGQLLSAVRRALHGIEPMAGTHVDTMYASIGLAFLPSQVGALLMGSTGVLGLLLATIGLYGVMAYSVARRTREIGIRVAIGAARGDIARMMLRDAARITLAGTAFGLAVALFVTRPLAMFLVSGLKPDDPENFAVVAAAMLLTALASTCGPIVRAMRVDPSVTLRDE